MIEHIVVPVDFTPESDRALLAAPIFAGWAGATIELISVVEPDERVAVEPALAAVAARLGGPATYRIVESGGPPEAALLTELHRDEKALWCVGSHARGGLAELLRGSVSESLARDAHVPVVLVGPHVTSGPGGRALAVALDGTDASEVILPATADIAAALGMSMRLLQVADLADERLPTDAVETGVLVRAATKVSSIDPWLADYDVLHGDHPARSLADYVAAQRDIGMVAVGTRGLTGRARLLHGSTAFELARRATVPVLILHHV